MRAILALNSGKNECGDLSRETMDRTDAAMHYAASRSAATVIMVGGDADSMCKYAAEHFPNGPQPLAENGPKDTLESAHFVKVGLLEPNGWNRLDIFTSDFHVPRTEWIFSKVLGDTYNVSMHPVEVNYISDRKMRLVKRREQAQLAVVKCKLIGLGPDSDARREKRLACFRFRGGESAIARLLMKADNMTNINRD